MQKFLNTLWEFTGGKEGKDNFIQNALNVCKVFKVKSLKTPKPDVPSKNTHRICFAKTFEQLKKSCRVFPFPRQVQSYQKSRKRLRPAGRR